MNIECDANTLEQLSSAFRFNDAVIRNLIIKRDEAITEPSLLIKSRELEQDEDAGTSEDDDQGTDDSDDTVSEEPVQEQI
jgi:small subunit ribosomal protein S6